jgi:protein-disulfide isomerase
MKNTQGIVVVIVVVIGLVAGGFLLSGSPSSSTPSSTSTNAGQAMDSKVLYNDLAPVIGSRDAKVKLVVFSDFLCPYCKQAHNVINDVLAKYPDASMQYRNLIVHADSRILSQAVEAANIQGKFKEMNDALFSKTVDTNEASVVALAKELGLDTVKFNADLNSDAVKNRIDQDEKDAVVLKLQGTPSVFMNAQSVENFNKLDEVVSKALGI